METRESIIGKVNKALALATNNDNLNEVIAALEVSSRLMAKWNLTKDDLFTDKDEQRIEERYIESGGSRAQWTRSVWHAVAQLNFCKYYNIKGREIALTHVLIGTPGNVESVKVMALYITETIENMSRVAAIRGTQKAAFKLGAASRIYWRVMDLIKLRSKGENQNSGNPDNLPALANLYKVHADANEEFYTTLHQKKLKKAVKSVTKDAQAFGMGYVAADNIPLTTQIK